MRLEAEVQDGGFWRVNVGGVSFMARDASIRRVDLDGPHPPLTCFRAACAEYEVVLRIKPDQISGIAYTIYDAPAEAIQ